MQPSLAGIPLLLFTILIHAFSPPSPLSLVSTNSTGMDKHVNEKLSNLSAGWQIFCSGDFYGNHMNAASCRNAWQKIDSSPQTYRFIPPSRRSSERLEAVAVPIRYLNDDGICAIVRFLPLPFRSLTLICSYFAKPSGILQW